MQFPASYNTYLKTDRVLVQSDYRRALNVFAEAQDSEVSHLTAAFYRAIDKVTNEALCWMSREEAEEWVKRHPIIRLHTDAIVYSLTGQLRNRNVTFLCERFCMQKAGLDRLNAAA